MKVLKIIGKIVLVLLIILLVLFTLYFLFGNEGYGIDMLKDVFSGGFFAGIKTFFVDIWNGIKFVFKA
ncbi:MAG: hypothetical protein IJ529_03955 [Alphaproteobacteria bacterium]|nr:hypothetical protein [Alphaproteobacteria bacterium]MBR1943464.1 hypothetical protein [bacterium]